MLFLQHFYFHKPDVAVWKSEGRPTREEVDYARGKLRPNFPVPVVVNNYEQDKG